MIHFLRSKELSRPPLTLALERNVHGLVVLRSCLLRDELLHELCDVLRHVSFCARIKRICRRLCVHVRDTESYSHVNIAGAIDDRTARADLSRRT